MAKNRLLVAMLLMPILALPFLLAGMSGCDSHCIAPELLDIADTNVIAGPKRFEGDKPNPRGSQEKFYIFIDVHPQDGVLKPLITEEATDLLRRTATHLAQRYMSKDKNLKFEECKVDVASIGNKNEYAQADFSSMTSYGSLSLIRRADGTLDVSADTIQYPK